MNQKILLILFIVIVCIYSSSANNFNISCSTSEYSVLDTMEVNYSSKEKKIVKAANKLYDQLAYVKAIQRYEKLDELQDAEKLKLANAYRLINDTKNAEKWYRDIAQTSKDPIVYFQLAQSLQSNGKYEEAAIYFDKYAKSNFDESEWDKLSKSRASKVLNTKRFNTANLQLQNESEINTKGIEYSPAYFKDEIIFVSTRSKQSFERQSKDPWIDENFMSLYSAPRIENTPLGKPKEFSYDINSRYHEGPVCFTNNGEVIFFTRNNFHQGERINDSQGIMKLEIFSANWDGENWINTKSLNFNLINSDECHPSISADGMKLYFSSNRPGGYGGMDLYVSENKYGIWTNPKNLGPTINTPGNEVFPFVHQNGDLFYASNGWDGLGGLDIFYATKIDKERWSMSINLGKPFNSEKDDFGFIVNEDGNQGYLSSNREGGIGKDDIYSFELEPVENSGISPLKNLTSNVYQHFSLSNIERIESIEMIEIAFEPQPISIRLPKKEVNFSNPEATKMNSGLKAGKSFVLEHVYYAFNSHKILKQAAEDLDNLVYVMKANPKWVVELGSHTDVRGTAAYNQALSLRRANAAVEYIVDSGIEPNRIIAKGYGEEIIRNHCRENVKCSDQEHQFNRRTEVRILGQSNIVKQQ